MAATRLVPLHVNKGKTIAQSLGDRTDYASNPEKTEKGELVSGYMCDPMTVDEEFLLSKRQYQQITGRESRHDVMPIRSASPSSPERSRRKTRMHWGGNSHFVSPRASTHSSSQRTRTGRIFIITSFSIPHLWMQPANSKTFGCQVLRCSGSAI